MTLLTEYNTRGTIARMFAIIGAVGGICVLAVFLPKISTVTICVAAATGVLWFMCKEPWSS